MKGYTSDQIRVISFFLAVAALLQWVILSHRISARPANLPPRQTWEFRVQKKSQSNSAAAVQPLLLKKWPGPAGSIELRQYVSFPDETSPQVLSGESEILPLGSSISGEWDGGDR